jgi:tetratricopeptide (TPR) repeat protein
VGNGVMLGDARAVAAEVGELLQSMRGILDASMDPDRLALRSLGVEGLGWTRSAYSEEAFQAWSALLQRAPDRFQVTHHLAIMHHARAMDLEASRRPESSNGDWEAALRYWRELHGSDAFWDYVAGIACKKAKRDAVEELRRKFPELLLQVHFDIAYAEGTAARRAGYHVKLVDQAPFPAEAKVAVRRETYARFISRVPDTVWQMDTLDPQIIKQGTDAIEHFLKIDPGCVPALEDAVRLQVRLVRARHMELQAAGEDSTARRRLLNAFKQDADYWRDYFGQLVTQAEATEEDIRQKMALWYRIMGDVHRALDLHDKAVELYETGAEAAAEGEDERDRCLRNAGETMAYIARERVHGHVAGARQYCDKVWQKKGLSPTAHFLLANAYLLLDNFDRAEQSCRAGLAIEPSITDLDAMQEHEMHREHLARMLGEVGKARRRHEAQSFLDKAKKQLEKEEFEDALSSLTRAVGIAPDEAVGYFLRAQACVALGQVAEARNDVAAFRRLLGEDAPAEAREAADRLENDINQMGEQVRRFGVETPRLRRAAAAAFNDDKFDVAEEKLRRAVERCRPAGKKEVEKELAAVLLGSAVRSVNAAMEESEKDPGGVARVFRTALGKLEEAARLDPQDQQIRQQLETLRKLEEQAREAAGMERKFGKEALKYLALAGQAAQSERYSSAEQNLRKAIKACPAEGLPDLECRLATVLTNWAVSEANKATSSNRDNVLRQSRERLREAVRLDPSSQHARDNLALVERALAGRTRTTWRINCGRR